MVDLLTSKPAVIATLMLALAACGGNGGGNSETITRDDEYTQADAERDSTRIAEDDPRGYWLAYDFCRRFADRYSTVQEIQDDYFRSYSEARGGELPGLAGQVGCADGYHKREARVSYPG
jgi:hypothetical protein